MYDSYYDRFLVYLAHLQAQRCSLLFTDLFDGMPLVSLVRVLEVSSLCSCTFPNFPLHPREAVEGLVKPDKRRRSLRLLMFIAYLSGKDPCMVCLPTYS